VDGIIIDEQLSTGATSIIVGADTGENMIIAVPGATGQVNAPYVQTQLCLDIIKNSKILLCQLEIPVEGALEALSSAKAHGVRTIWNAAPAQQDLPPGMFPLTDILCINEIRS